MKTNEKKERENQLKIPNCTDVEINVPNHRQHDKRNNICLSLTHVDYTVASLYVSFLI
ncbi:hypothetical protein DAPPUDRAFT_302784 [Daphnia pulex]|uniref:Uncharacterized protein n=1 Tax=Daphnia pulex TaxID=6669 RepID=E9GET1_DAPPU|nr:hypothetical protein DAPPUDRAFT_302784 [Daphnia pulex]|eukprot:EFX81889.1 hypothetical protein DAPPUDRAFT_302784 [Daphnia pulex]